MPVYDQEKTTNTPSADGSHDDMGVHPERREAEVADLENLYNADSAGTTADEKEKAKLDDQVGEGYTDEPPTPKKRRWLTRDKGIAGAVIGVTGGGIIATILFFSPAAKLNAMLENINQRAFATVSGAVEKRMGYLFERYMITRITGMETCRAARSIDCKVNYNKGLVSSLFTQWQDVKAEQRMFDKLGFQLESQKNPDQDTGHRFIVRDRAGRQISSLQNANDWNNFKGQYKGGHRAFGRDINKAMKAEFEWYQVLQRRSIRNTLKRKHGVKFWCFWACDKKDSLEDKKDMKKAKYKAKFVERFIYPNSPRYGAILDCLMAGGVCDTDKIRQKVDVTKLSKEQLDDIANDFTNNPNRSFSQRVMADFIEKSFRTATGKAAAQTVTKAIPYAGQALLAMMTVEMIDNLDNYLENGGLTKMAAAINTAQYVHYYSNMRSLNDEAKSHELTLEELGPVIEDLQNAEQSHLYQHHNGAAGSENHIVSDPDYKCPDGKPIPDGELVCEEKKFDRKFMIEEMRQNSVIDGLSSIFEVYRDCYSVVGPPVPVPEVGGRCIGGTNKTRTRFVLNTINKTSEFFLGPISSGLLAMAKASPAGYVVELIEEKSAELSTYIFERVFPLPVQIDSPGRDKYDALEAGAEVVSTEFAKGGIAEDGSTYGIGAPPISDEDYSLAANEYLTQLDYEFNSSDLWTKIASIDQPRSLISRLALSFPLNYNHSTIVNSLAVYFNGMFSNTLVIFSKMALHTVGAQSPIQQQLSVNPFGIERYGYRLDDPALARDPDELTDEFCAESRKRREESKTEHPVTGFDMYTVADPCLLEEVVVEAGSSIYIDEPDDGTAMGGSVGNGSLPTGEARELAQQILDSGKVTGALNYMNQIRAVASGDNSCNVSPTILALIKAISDDFEIYITSLNRKCTGVLTASGTGSYHWRDGGGHALDIGIVNGKSSTGATQEDRALLEAVLPILPSGSGIGQVNCRSTPLKLPQGITQFNDSCNHIHIQVPVK